MNDEEWIWKKYFLVIEYHKKYYWSRYSSTEHIEIQTFKVLIITWGIIAGMSSFIFYMTHFEIHIHFYNDNIENTTAKEMKSSQIFKANRMSRSIYNLVLLIREQRYLTINV